MTTERFDIVYDEGVVHHLAAIGSKHHSMIRDTMFYKIDSGRRAVHVVAIGVKERARLFVAGKEMTS